MQETLNKDLLEFEESTTATEELGEESTTTTEELEEESTTTPEEMSEEETEIEMLVYDNSDVVSAINNLNDTVSIILIVLLFLLFRNWISDILSKIITYGKD